MPLQPTFDYKLLLNANIDKESIIKKTSLQTKKLFSKSGMKKYKPRVIMAQVRQEVTTKQLPMMFMKSTKKYIQMWVFLVAQLQNDTSTEYCILKSVLQVLFYSRVHNSLLFADFSKYMTIYRVWLTAMNIKPNTTPTRNNAHLLYSPIFHGLHLIIFLNSKNQNSQKYSTFVENMSLLYSVEVGKLIKCSIFL